MNGWRCVGRIGLGLTLGLVLAFSAGRCRGVTIEMVRVGDPGNVADTEVMNDGTTGYGGVEYVYWIGKYEVTNGQYREFLNAKAALGDPYALYSPGDMPGTELDGVFSGITRSGSGSPEEPYAYSAKDDDSAWDTRPVNFVSWFDAVRFINWLENGQGAGDTETGTYTILDGGPDSGEVIVPTLAERRSWTTPHFVFPTEDEWYKAAYYKGGSRDAGYWDYATQSDTVPDNNPPELDTGNSANYFNYNDDDYGYAVGPPYYSTGVGAYELSTSAYGTFDQSGNVHEWTEDAASETARFNRGGSMGHSDFFLSARVRGRNNAGSEWATMGFRVGVIPEPGSFVLLGSGAVLMLFLRRRQRAGNAG
jgi:sulfatase modifying factor 1